MARYKSSHSEVAISKEPMVTRAFTLFLLMMCAALLLVSTSDNPRIKPLQNALMEVATPIVSTLSQPAKAWKDAVQWWDNITHVYSENVALRRSNDALKHWQSVAMALESENKELRQLAGYRPVESTAYITARMVGYSETASGHQALLNVGFNDGVRSHQAVVSTDGLIGRISQVSDTHARLLLLTDMNARVPVIGVVSREKALLVGTGSSMPKLQFIAQNSQLKVGEALVSTEDGGVIPAGIAVGKIFARHGSDLRVWLQADAKRTTYVRVISHDTPLESAPTQ